jgi:hypothetical protein
MEMVIEWRLEQFGILAEAVPAEVIHGYSPGMVLPGVN